MRAALLLLDAADVMIERVIDGDLTAALHR